MDTCLVNIVLVDENDLFSTSSCCACKCLTALLDGVCMIDKGATSWKKLSNLSKDTKERNTDGFNVGGVLKWIRNSLQSTNNDHVLDEKWEFFASLSIYHHQVIKVQVRH